MYSLSAAHSQTGTEVNLGCTDENCVEASESFKAHGNQ